MSDRDGWGPLEYLSEFLCRSVGCGSVVRWWQPWGDRLVCDPICNRLDARRGATPPLGRAG